jgi:hypothetical protein
MILRNKRTREIINITLSEFKIRFAKEIETAFDGYMRAKLTKPYFKLRNIDEADFYFGLNGTLTIMPVLIGI